MAWVRIQRGGTAFKSYLQTSTPWYTGLLQNSGAEGSSAEVDE